MLRSIRLDRSALLTYALWAGKALIPLYVVCMFIAPAVMTGFDWQKVQNVWDRWQALNVGLLAFASSLIALSIARSLEDERRRRRFSAAKAFLPHALSELSVYLAECPMLLQSALTAIELRKREQNVLYAPSPPTAPKAPHEYKSIFSSCIEHSDSEIGEHLARILELQQQLEVRLFDTEAWLSRAVNKRIYEEDRIYQHYLRLARLFVLVEATFPFARGETGALTAPEDRAARQAALKKLGVSEAVREQVP